jgi:hypothetical protein
MRLAKPILLTATPLGIIGGLYEAWKLSAGLAFLMAAMMGVMAAAIGSVVLTVRRERAGEEQRQRLATPTSGAQQPLTKGPRTAGRPPSGNQL